MTSAIGDMFELPVRMQKVFSKKALGSPSRLSLRKSAVHATAPEIGAASGLDRAARVELCRELFSTLVGVPHCDLP